MDIDHYQSRAEDTALEHAKKDLWYTALGLNGEAGEVAEKVKKLYRDDGGKMTPERRDALVKELGGVLWYLAQTATLAGIALSEVAGRNLAQLKIRQDKGLLQGDGDDRGEEPRPCVTSTLADTRPCGHSVWALPCSLETNGCPGE